MWFAISKGDSSERNIPPISSVRQITQMIAGLPHQINSFRKTECKGQLPMLHIHDRAFFSVYEAGVEYHMHLDSYGGSDNSRMLTIIAYLNEGWEKGMGGELRVYDSDAADGKFVDVAPLAGRVVMFKSHEVHHAVLPANFKRLCIQIWSHGE